MEAKVHGQGGGGNLVPDPVPCDCVVIHLACWHLPLLLLRTAWTCGTPFVFKLSFGSQRNRRSAGAQAHESTSTLDVGVLIDLIDLIDMQFMSSRMSLQASNMLQVDCTPLTYSRVFHRFFHTSDQMALEFVTMSSAA